MTDDTIEDLKVGDKVQFLCNGRGRGGHCRVIIEITKINRKTIEGFETDGSYAAVGPYRKVAQTWRVSKTTETLYKRTKENRGRL